MGSITERLKVTASGKTVKTYRVYIRRSVNGKEVSKSKVFGTKTEAKDWLRENENDSGLKAIAGATGPTFANLLDAFVLAPPAKGTKFWLPSHIDFWRAELGAMKTGAIDRGTINTCKAKLMVKPATKSTLGGVKDLGKAVTPATVNRYLATLSSVFNFAMQRDIINVHPMKGGAVSKEAESEGRRRILTPAEEEALYSACDASKWAPMRLYLRLCLTTAARKSEVLGLRWDGIDLDRSVAILPKTKNGKARALPLVSDVKAALLEASKVRALNSEFVFFDPKRPTQPKNIDSLWRAVRQRAGLWQDREDVLDHVVLHSTRHTATTKLVRKEKNIARVQAVTGHKTLAMLGRYTHLDTDDAVSLAERALGGT
ncbi:site-specific integrase [Pseudorhodoferax sp. Leaf265]|uniref:tyrosine-type recombinase/integrase n=1 Tax=Pseudorhodoferax sp. Leaf265 TaxID=1736315 RepID=UPI0009E6724D|nr:site-specific integrase [Pseudorhodoferax sp. Leaf265]